MKLKIKITLFSVILMCFFLGSFATKATTRIHSITYPETVRVDETFDINVNFDYEYGSNALYGDYIWLYYDIYGENITPEFSTRQYILTSIAALDDAPRPAQVTIEVDLSTLTHRVDETFRFKVKWIQGVISGSTVLKSGESYSEVYELTIGAKGASIPIIGIIVPLFVLSIAVLIRKKKRMKKLN